MKLQHLQLKGFSPAFPDVVDIPLEQLDPGVVAVVGHNGAGKTTLMEAVCGAAYRQMPSADGADPVTYATNRDAFLDLTFTTDEDTLRCRLNMDGPKRKTDATLERVRPDGSRELLNDGKVSTFDQVIRQFVPSWDIWINGPFAAQGRGDEFIRRKPSQRKDLFGEMLGLARYFTMAETAKAAAARWDARRTWLLAKLEQLRAETADGVAEAIDRRAQELQVTGGHAELQQRDLKVAIADLKAQLATAQDAVAAFTTADARVKAIEREHGTRYGERQRLDADITTVRDQVRREIAAIEKRRAETLADIDKRLAGNEELQGKADEIRQAVAAIEVIDKELVIRRAALQERQGEHQGTTAALHAAERRLAALAPIEQRLDRSRRDAGLLGTVPCKGVQEYSACQFLHDALAARDQIARLEEELRPKAVIADEIAEHRRGLDQLTTTITSAQTSVKVAEEHRAALAQMARYADALAAAEARVAELTEKRAAAERDAEALIAAARQRQADAEQRHLDRAEELDGLVARLAADLAAAQQQRDEAAAGNTHAAQWQTDLAARRRAWDQATSTLAAVDAGRQDLERRRRELAEATLRVEQLRVQLATVDQSLLEWKDLAKALGKGGLPDLEIDAAGPTISALTNDILSSCFGPRFTVELVTQVVKSDGSGVKDSFTLQVLDNELGGDWRDITRFSGGQRTILQEAFMLAVSIYVNERTTTPVRTLWRDETGAALDVENAKSYVQMLRRAREIGGFHHVYFVSHTPAAAALADAQIQVGEGQARIVLAPFEAAA